MALLGILVVSWLSKAGTCANLPAISCAWVPSFSGRSVVISAKSFPPVFGIERALPLSLVLSILATVNDRPQWMHSAPTPKRLVLTT